MNKKVQWRIKDKKGDFREISSKYNIDQVIGKIMVNRGVSDLVKAEEYINGKLCNLPSPWLLKGMREAVNILDEKITSGKKIRILGDYDIDGVTSTFILLSALKRIGANVDTYIPHRIIDGYGIHDHIIDKVIEDGVDTIITCDNGISASKEIERAIDKGITVIVTDHHEIPFEEYNGEKIYKIPKANVVINPKQIDCLYPNKNICGGLVAYKVLCALYEKHGIIDEAYDLIEFAAIATVGDVMVLQGENRIIVKEGLKKILNTKNVGLRKLIEVNDLLDKHITGYHIGFIIGPCINAVGRLDTASTALKLFCANNEETALKYALELKKLNDERKYLTEEGKNEAIMQIERSNMKNEDVLVVYLPNCHESIAGIIAGRIREAYNKPTFVLTKGKLGAKGSGRSIEAFSMYENMVKIKELFLEFGGHPMAAGLSLKEENIDEFRKRINENSNLTEEDLIEKIYIDIKMPLGYCNMKFIESLNILEPFGNGNEKPIFAQKDLIIKNIRIIGKTNRVLKLILNENGKNYEAIYFGDASEVYEDLKDKTKIDIIYYPDINEYNGVKTIQFIIKDYR